MKDFFKTIFGAEARAARQGRNDGDDGDDDRRKPKSMDDRSHGTSKGTTRPKSTAGQSGKRPRSLSKKRRDKNRDREKDRGRSRARNGSSGSSTRSSPPNSSHEDSPSSSTSSPEPEARQTKTVRIQSLPRGKRACVQCFETKASDKFVKIRDPNCDCVHKVCTMCMEKYVHAILTGVLGGGMGCPKCGTAFGPLGAKGSEGTETGNARRVMSVGQIDVRAASKDESKAEERVPVKMMKTTGNLRAASASDSTVAATKPVLKAVLKKPAAEAASKPNPSGNPTLAVRRKTMPASPAPKSSSPSAPLRASTLPVAAPKKTASAKAASAEKPPAPKPKPAGKPKATAPPPAKPRPVQPKPPPPVTAKEKDCDICMNSYPATKANFPKATLKCTHSVVTCKSCLNDYLTSRIKENKVMELHCPECDSEVGPNDIVRIGTRQLRDSYDHSTFVHYQRNDPNYKACPTPNCTGGHIHVPDDNNNIFKCEICKKTFCAVHNIDHSNETCAAYEARTQTKRDADKLSEDAIRASTRPCPKCSTPIMKSFGCDHMKCGMAFCGYEFCFVCGADYNAIRTQGNGAHERTCKFHSDNLAPVPMSLLRNLRLGRIDTPVPAGLAVALGAPRGGGQVRGGRGASRGNANAGGRGGGRGGAVVNPAVQALGMGGVDVGNLQQLLMGGMPQVRGRGRARGEF